MSIKSVVPSNHLILCCPFLLLPSILQFLLSGGPSIRVLASASVLPIHIQDWFLLGFTHLISCSPRDSQESSPTPQFKSINSLALSLLQSPTLTEVPFSSCPQSFSASGSFPESWLFTSGGQSIGASASAAVLPMNIQGWFPLGLTSLISLQTKGFSRVFSNTTFQKHQFFGAQLSLWSNSHIHTWLLKKP